MISPPPLSYLCTHPSPHPFIYRCTHLSILCVPKTESYQPLLPWTLEFSTTVGLSAETTVTGLKSGYLYTAIFSKEEKMHLFHLWASPGLYSNTHNQCLHPTGSPWPHLSVSFLLGLSPPTPEGYHFQGYHNHYFSPWALSLKYWLSFGSCTHPYRDTPAQLQFRPEHLFGGHARQEGLWGPSEQRPQHGHFLLDPGATTSLLLITTPPSYLPPHGLSTWPRGSSACGSSGPAACSGCC